MDEGGRSEVDYMKDIEEIRFGTTSEEEDDEDEPRLRIDTSDEDDSALDEASVSGTSKDGSIRSGKTDADTKTNPLQSLQQLVHSPYLDTQISADSQGCTFTPIDRSKSIVSLDAKSIEMIRSSAINFDAAKSRRKPKEIKNAFNFQRLSPVSIEVVPSLPHLLPPQMSPPKEKMNSRLNYVVNRLRTSATEEEHLRHLQRLQSSPEGENFRLFQQFLKSGQFQARCNNNNLEVLPANANLINLTNKGCSRYAQKSAFGMPTLKFKDFGTPRMDFRMPPALTAIPKNYVPTKKTNYRRSPPPMVPIESIANFRKPLNEDNVVSRLKKLGTDIELERTGGTERTNVVVTNDKTLPFLKPIDERVSTKLHPPPSLIPIKSGSRFVPILPNLNANEITIVPKKTPSLVKKRKKTRLTAKSEYTRLAHALVQAATPSAAAPKIENNVPIPIHPDVLLRTDDEEEEENAKNERKYFVFNPNVAVPAGVLPNGRKMLSCDICSGVYHKMYSLKKHYYRNHINPKFVSDKHFAMFKLVPIKDELRLNPRCNTALYWCSICTCLFDDKKDLSSHLTDHPPVALEAANKNARLYQCEYCNMGFPKKRTQDRHTKKCAAKIRKPKPYEGSDEASNESCRTDEVEEELPKIDKLETSMMCLFCELSFTDTIKRKKHVLKHHHPKRKQQPCVYCKNKTFSDLSDLLKHICEMHSKRYFGCAICKIRFRTKEDLVAHNAESHDTEDADKDDDKKSSSVANKNGKNFKCNQCSKVFNNTVEMGRHKKNAHRDSRHNIKKVVSSFSAAFDNEQKYRSTIITTADYETEFYKNVCGNVKYNMENCMDGRIEMKKDENEIVEEVELPSVEIESDPAPLCFQDMYGTEDIDSRFIHNVSRLHLATQLTILRKANLLDKQMDSPCSSITDSTTIASRLALAEKPDVQRNEEEAKNDNGTVETVFSGEWIKPRDYICGTCFASFNNFWDMEDHRWIRHPNVWGFYYEFVAEQAPGANWAMKRFLQGHGTLGIQAANTVPVSSSTCTKCQKVVTPVAEFHKHILECGGDTTWTSMACAAHTKRNKKWKPYAGRRRKNVARHRGLKRNIPTTPVKIIGPPRNRQKAGDTETIQRMIANLPPKRITRRVITFDDIDLKSKSRFNVQTSMLTRKRKETLDTRSSRAQESRSRVATSSTLIGTKNSTPYIKNRTATRAKAVPVSEKVESTDKMETSELVCKTEPGIFTEISNTKDKNEIGTQPSDDSDTSSKVTNEVTKMEVDEDTTESEMLKNSPTDKTDKSDEIAIKNNESEPKTDELKTKNRISAEGTSKCKNDSKLAAGVGEVKKNKALIIKIQSESKKSDKPVTIIRSDKKRKKRCTPVTAKRLVGESKKSDVPKIDVVADTVVVEQAETRKETEESPIPDEAADKAIDEGEIDLEMIIEPADEDSPTLPDTSVILAAMKETMRQTDAVISTMPVNAPSAGKKRKRDDGGKCKKCGTKIEVGANCETCHETKKLKPVQTTKSECFTCKVCRVVVVGKVRNDEMCEKCVIAVDTSDKKRKAKDARVAQFRCRKCDTVCAAPADGSLYCEKCSRLQESVCLLCKTTFISDTDDKVCGKCMLAGSSKQKKRNLEDPPIAVITAEFTETAELENKCCERCKDTVKCSCKKRKTSGQLETYSTEMVCDNCGKKYADRENAGGSICRGCRQTYEKNVSKSKTEHGGRTEEEIKCAECSVLQTSEVTLKKLCDGCSSRKNERRFSNESRSPDMKSNTFTGFGDESCSRHRTEDYRSDGKEEAAHGASNDHKTPMKNVKLICRGCYGVFDTVSSYKFHCDNCKHRNTEKKPLLSFAKRNAKSVAESGQSENGASFEILEGVQIKFVEMANSQQDKADAKDTPAQIPLVVYESDSSPTKKTDASRTQKKHKRTQSSLETIMDTIESVIKSVCYPDQPQDEKMEEKIDEKVGELVPDSSRNVSEQTSLPEKPNDETQPASGTSTKPKTTKNTKKKSKKSKKNVAKESELETSVEIEENKNAKSDNVDKATDEVKKPAAKNTKSKARVKPKANVSVAPRRSWRLSGGKFPVGSAIFNLDETDEDLKKWLSQSDVKTDADVEKNAKNSKCENDDAKTRRNSDISEENIIGTERTLRRRSRDNADDKKINDTEMVTDDEKISAAKKRQLDNSSSDARKAKFDDTGKKNSKGKTDPKNDEDCDVDESADTEHTKDVPEQIAADTAERILRRRSSEISDLSKGNSSSHTPIETRSRRNSATVSECGNFFEANASCKENESLNDEQNSYAESYESHETSQTSNSWAWDFLDQKSLGSILDTVNEILSRPEVSSCSSDSVDSFREEMMMFQHFGREIGALEKQDDDSKQDEETTITDLDEISNKSNQNKNKTFLKIGSNSTECDFCDQTFAKPETLKNHIINFHGIDPENEYYTALGAREDDEKTIIDLDKHSGKLDSSKKDSQKTTNTSSSSNVNDECDLCDQTFSKPNALKNHMDVVHADDAQNKHSKDNKLKQANKGNQNGMKNTKHKCNHCHKVLQNKAETILHMKEHWKSFAFSNSDNGSHLKNSIADKLEELLLDKALVNYLKSPQETQQRNNLPLKILNQISLAKKNQFTNWKSALAQVLDMAQNPSTAATPVTPPPAETAPVFVEPKSNKKTEGTESNADPVEGYPCPMCHRTFPFTRLRNTHLIMVHAPRQSTHKHLIEKNESKKDTKNKLSNDGDDTRNETAREKVFHSYLMKDSVNTVVKKDSVEDQQTSKTSASCSNVNATDSKKADKFITPKIEPASSLPPSTGKTKSNAVAGTSNVVASTSNAVAGTSNEEDQSKKKKPCRKKMSKKEMNLPAAIVKMKAEQALLQLCNSRFSRICSQ